MTDLPNQSECRHFWSYARSNWRYYRAATSRNAVESAKAWRGNMRWWARRRRTASPWREIRERVMI
jgi:hypothetical protein